MSNNLNIQELLSALENEEHSNLLNTSFEQIAKDKNDILQQLQLETELLKTYHNKLKSYRYIDELNDLKYGQYVRWINIKNPESLKLTNGGIFLEIKLLDTGTHMIIKNNMNRIFQINMDQCIVFQKISDQEKIILLALKYLNN
tara:strand:+ start:437 stop:868 length:432 start_codon:yes stop_codon:yes gene_type:complete